MNLFRIAARAASLAALCLLFAGPAKADVVFVDANDQPKERAEAEALAKKYGETIHVVTAGRASIDDQLSELFQKAERGEIELGTLIVSGHSNGEWFFGKNGGIYGLDDLAKKFPKAAETVKSFIGLGCYSATRYNALEWQRRFPDASVIAGFGGSAPSGDWSVKYLTQVFTTIANARKRAGGTQKLAEKLGKDRSAKRALESTLQTLESMRVTTGTYQVCGDFHDPKPVSKDHLERAALVEGPREYQRYFTGELPIPADTHHSPLRQYYNDLHDYLAYADDNERAALLPTREQAIRLVFFENVKKAFSKNHADDVDALNAALDKAGETVRFPDAATLASMDRKAVLDLVDELEDAKKSLKDPKAKDFVNTVRNELKDLAVPPEWIQ